MKRLTLDKHIERHYQALRKRAAWKYADRGEDALQDAVLALYESQHYKTLPESLSSARIFGVLCKCVNFAFLDIVRKDNGRQDLIKPLGPNEEYPEEGVAVDPLYDLKNDVQKALGTLSAYHYSLVVANLIEEVPLREIALRTGETFYRVFTELEIAKAYLRTELADYRTSRDSVRY